jgi:hypothetical protein
MKHVYVAIIILLSWSGAAHAQGSFGLKGGLNLAKQKIEFDGASATLDTRVGFHVGGYFNYAFNDQFSLQPELLYNSIGSQANDVVFKFNYISSPIVLKYNPVPIFNIHAGPQLGFLLSAKATDGDDSEDVKEDIKPLDFGFAFGGGLDFASGVNFSVRYVLGLSNIDDTDVDPSSSLVIDPSLKNNVIQFSLGFTFK